jgi:flagellar assembly protein FliH
MRNYSRFIPGEEIEGCEQWRFGAIDTAAQLLEAQVKVREAAQSDAQVQALRHDSFQAGYADGLIQGRVQAEAELQQQMADFLAKQAQTSAQRLAEIFSAAQSELTRSRQVVAQGVLELACELARQVVRQELSVKPNVMLPVIREAVELLDNEHQSAVVRLHPSDLDLLEVPLTTELTGLPLVLRADPMLEPGGCVVESAGMVVDATLQKRWQRAVATLGLVSAWEVPSEPS